MPDDVPQSGNEHYKHEYNHRCECEKSDPVGRGRHQREFEGDRLGREKAVKAQDAKCDTEYDGDDEKNPRAWKVIALFDTNSTGLLCDMRRIGKKQGRDAEKSEE
jgi:hypothetical protein